MLTSAQINQFKRDGVLKLPGFFSTDEVERWRNQILDLFHHPATGEDWRKAISVHKSSDLKLVDGPSVKSHPELIELYADLHTSARWIGKSELRVRAPDIDLKWLGARAPHLDFPMVGSTRTLANNMIYLSEVSNKGGAFMYWRGSHRIAWDYFRRNPMDYRSQGNLAPDQIFEVLQKEMTTEPEEFLGRAGDLLIWHALTLHSGSVNLQTTPRLALIGRWGTPLDGEAYFDFEEDMWSQWSFATDHESETVAGHSR
jgi:hypothetical protein